MKEKSQKFDTNTNTLSRPQSHIPHTIYVPIQELKKKRNEFKWPNKYLFILLSVQVVVIHKLCVFFPLRNLFNCAINELLSNVDEFFFPELKKKKEQKINGFFWRWKSHMRVWYISYFNQSKSHFDISISGTSFRDWKCGDCVPR